MSEKGNLLTIALRSVFAPIVKQSSKWPPILAYGVPGIVAVLLIVLFRSTLPDNLFGLVLIVILAPLLGYIFTDWDKRRQVAKLKIARLGTKLTITGNVFLEDEIPLKGATVFVEGIDRRKETDDTGWFQITVDEQDSWTVRATYGNQTAKLTVAKDGAGKPVRLILKRASNSNNISSAPQKMPSRKVSLQAWNGQYVCAVGGGGGEVLANRKEIDESAKFDLIELGNNKIQLRAQNGDFVSAVGGGGDRLVANRRNPLEFETFDLFEIEDDKVYLRTHKGQYVSAAIKGEGDAVVATQDIRGEYETFRLIRQFETKFLPIPLLPGIGNSYLRNVYLDPPLGDVVLGGVKFRLEPDSLIFDTNRQIRYYVQRPDGSKEIELQLREPVNHVRSAFFLINSGNSKSIYASEKVGEIILVFKDAPPLVTELVLGQNIREWCLGHSGDWVRETSSSSSRVVWRGMSKDGENAVIDCLEIPVYEIMRSNALEKIIFVHRPTRRSSDTLGVHFFVSAVSLEMEQSGT